MTCLNPLILEIPILTTESSPLQHFAGLTKEATIAEILGCLGTDCLEIRFESPRVFSAEV